MSVGASATVLEWAGVTETGRVRSINQDRYLIRTGLWMVADGMGGHRGGEIASAIACEVIDGSYEVSPAGIGDEEELVEAVKAANDAVHEAGDNDPDLTGMGTTVVALGLVEQDGDEVLAVANVGDSRAYRMSGGRIEQLTEDHSLVADMVREGSLSPDEAANHPQRNILTRVLGVYENIEVDVVTIIPRVGDRYVLCSDGLFNEVAEDAIAAALRRLVNPQEAAEELVRQAVESGGRDNVTVVIVDVVADGGRAESAAETLADEDAAAPPIYSDDLMATDGEVDTDNGAGRLRRARRRGPRHSAAKPRRFTWRVLLFSLIVLAVLGGAFATIQWYGRSAYYVGIDNDDQVAIYRGRPGGVLWIDPTLEKTTKLSLKDVPDDAVDDVRSGKEVASREEAQRYVTNLEERHAATTTTTTTSTTTTTTAPPPPSPAP